MSMREKITRNRIFVCPILPENVVKKYGASFAANNFCTNLLSEQDSFDEVLVTLPVRKTKREDLVYADKRIVPAHCKWFRKSKYLSRLAFLPEAFMMFRQIRRGDVVWYYNLPYTLAPLFLLLRLLKPSVQQNIIILDYTPGINGVRGMLYGMLLRLMNMAHGTICLSPNKLFTCRNTQCLPGVAPQGGSNPRLEKYDATFLVSGVLEENISLLESLLIPAFKHIPQCKLVITGQLKEEDRVRKSLAGYANIEYKGQVSLGEYFEILHSITFLLSTRNPEAPENQCNFPSKIIEALLHNRIVVSTLPYRQLEGIKYFQCSTDVETFQRQVLNWVSRDENELREYANQEALVKKKFCTRVWVETMNQIEEKP